MGKSNRRIRKESGLTLLALVVAIGIMVTLLSIATKMIGQSETMLTRTARVVDTHNVSEEIERLKIWYNDNILEQYIYDVSSFVDMSGSEIEETLEKNNIKGTIIEIEGNGSTDDKIRVRYDKTHNMYEINLVTGEVTYVGKINEDLKLVDPSIKFTYSTTEWTNENVIVHLTMTQGEGGTDATGNYRIKYYTTEEGKWKVYNDLTGIVIEKNSNIYAQVQSLLTGEAKTTWISGQVNKIDKTKPQVTSVASRTSTATISAEDLGDDGSAQISGIFKYGYSTSENVQPTEWQTSNTFRRLQQAQTYYFWVKDIAGNVSQPYDAITGTLGTPVFSGLTWSDTKVNSASIVIAGEQEEAVLQYKIGATGQWKTVESGAVIEDLTANTTVYGRLYDETNESSVYASTTITESTDPIITITESAITSTRIEFTATDEESGIVSYYITESNTAPSAESNVWDANRMTPRKTITESDTGFVKQRKYYVYVLDGSGNVASANTTTHAIGKPTFGTTSWSTTSGNRATATLVGSANDCVLQYKVGLDGTWATITSGATIPAQPSGTTVYGRLYDYTNESGDYASLVILDNTKPEVSLTASKNTSSTTYTKDDVILTGTATDSQSLVTSYGWGQTAGTDIVATGSTTQTKTVTESGTYYFTARDGAGNEDTEEVEVYIDKTEPVASVSARKCYNK